MERVEQVHSLLLSPANSADCVRSGRTLSYSPHETPLSYACATTLRPSKGRVTVMTKRKKAEWVPLAFRQTAHAATGGTLGARHSWDEGG